MKVLIAVKGSEDAGYFSRIALLAPLRQADTLLAHVIDTGPRADLELGRERFLGQRPLSPERSADLTAAEDDRARAALQFARQALLAAGVTEQAIAEITLRGKPKEELRRLAENQQIDLIVVGGRPGRSGPHSVGKTARFLLDHAPNAALLIR